MLLVSLSGSPNRRWRVLVWSWIGLGRGSHLVRSLGFAVVRSRTHSHSWNSLQQVWSCVLETLIAYPGKPYHQSPKLEQPYHQTVLSTLHLFCSPKIVAIGSSFRQNASFILRSVWLPRKRGKRKDKKNWNHIFPKI